MGWRNVWMVPKIIHYCWFGGAPMPPSVQNCIDSWKKYCPDYELRLWDEKSFPLSSCSYVQEDYRNRKWAFVTDYVRFDVLYRYGGVYFDTDVELIRGIDDLVAKGPFMAMEGESECMVATGLGMASDKGNPLLKEILDYYHNAHFEEENGYLSTRNTVVEIVSNLLKKKGFRNENRIQEIAGFTIYPPSWFCPYDYSTGKLTITEDTRSIHHYDASWKTGKEKKWHDFRVRFANRHGYEAANRFFANPVVRGVGSLYRNGLKRSIQIVKASTRK